MNDKQPRLFHVLRAQQFDRELLDYLSELTNAVRKIAKSRDGMRFLHDQLFHKRAMLYFTQPSTRTFLSFENACHILGLHTSEIRDPSTSSELKGETKEDAIRTASSYVDLIVMRTPGEGFADRTAEVLDTTDRPIPVINAGSGKDQHPTQALLDIYTLHRSFTDRGRGSIDGKKIVMVGDLARGRTVRSLCYLMKNYQDVQLIFVSPPAFGMMDDLKGFLDERGIPFREHDNLEDVIPEADAIYMTRIQDEHDVNGESAAIDLTNFTFLERHLEILGEDSILMHPLPRRFEIEASVDSDPRAMYWRQPRNGMWMRSAIIATIFGSDEAILERYEM